LLNRWSTIRYAKWFIPLLVVLACLLIAGVVTAAAVWQSSTLTTNNSNINITTVAPILPNTYTLSTNAVTFGNQSFPVGTPIDIISNVVTLTNLNTSPNAIAGFNVVTSGLPSWLNASVWINVIPLSPGGWCDLAIRISGAAPSNPVSINLSSATFTITPYSY
jgi:hypothetical protein